MIDGTHSPLPCSSRTIAAIWMVYSIPDLYYDLDDSWAHFADGRVICGSCSGVAPGHMPKPIEPIVTNRPAGSVIWAKQVYGVLYRADLISCIAPYLSDPVIGRVHVREGDSVTPIDHHVTCYGGSKSAELTIHTGPRADYRVCVCGRVVSGARWTEPEHVVRADVENRHAFQDSSARLYVSTHLRATLDWSRWADIRFERVPVLDEALDRVNRPVM